MRGKYGRAAVDRGNETVGDLTAANVADQNIDRSLPLCAFYLLRDPDVGDNARIVLCHRHEDENATTITRMHHTADNKLLKRGAVRVRALYGTRYED